MKYLLLILMMMLTGCSKAEYYSFLNQPIFKVGDCVALIDKTDKEPWEKPSKIHYSQITMVGNKKYLVYWYYDGLYKKELVRSKDGIKISWQHIYDKVPCPEGHWEVVEK